MAVAVAPVAPVTCAPVAPAGLAPALAAQVARSAALAVERGLRLVGRGVCRVPGHEGQRVWAVASGSRATLAHLVWCESGRLQCDCEARRRGRFTCSHAQLVRSLLIVEAGAIAPASIPSPSPVAVEPEPEPEPPTPSPVCPSCGFPADAADPGELGECLECLALRTCGGALTPRCDRCGQVATAETARGVWCAACLELWHEERRAKESRASAEKSEAARRIIAREEERQRTYREQGRGDDPRTTPETPEQIAERTGEPMSQTTPETVPQPVKKTRRSSKAEKADRPTPASLRPPLAVGEDAPMHRNDRISIYR